MLIDFDRLLEDLRGGSGASISPYPDAVAVPQPPATDTDTTAQVEQAPVTPTESDNRN